MGQEKIETVEAYFAQFEGEQLTKLQEMQALLSERCSEADEVISYQMPTFKQNGKNLVHYAAYPNHIGLYPGPAVIAANVDLLDGLKFAKGSIQFPMDKPLPKTLILELIDARLEQFRRTGK